MSQQKNDPGTTTGPEAPDTGEPEAQPRAAPSPKNAGEAEAGEAAPGCQEGGDGVGQGKAQTCADGGCI